MLQQLYLKAEQIKAIKADIARGAAIREWFKAAMFVEIDECIEWPFAKIKGYGNIGVGGGKSKLVHNLSAEIKYGPRPPGTEAAHGPCHNRACFNYRHISYRTHRENQMDRRRDGTSNLGSKYAQLGPIPPKQGRDKW